MNDKKQVKSAVTAEAIAFDWRVDAILGAIGLQ